jgi:hypothetical protein
MMNNIASSEIVRFLVPMLRALVYLGVYEQYGRWNVLFLNLSLYFWASSRHNESVSGISKDPPPK